MDRQDAAGTPPAPGGGGEASGEGAVAAVVAVGDELLSGRTVDTNSAWLGAALAEAGVPVTRRFTVGDRDGEIREAVAAALATADLVVVTGGLGPTEDDRTLEAVAGLLGRPLEMDDGILEGLRERFRARGLSVFPASNARQARVPRGGDVLPNSRGTAPGILFREAGRLVVVLPGVPREMEAMMEASVLPRLPELLPGRLHPVRTRVIRTTGIPESMLADRLTPLLEGEGIAPVTPAFLPRITGVELRLSVRETPGPDPAAEARRHLDRAQQRVEEAIRRWTYRGEDLVDDVAEVLRARGLSMATAESCTGGLLGGRLTERPGASEWYAGGVVSYSNAAKTALLGVEPALLEAHGAVSEPVAAAMAAGAARRFQVPVAASITGVAGPGGGSPEKPVGMVCMAVVVGERTVTRTERLPGDRRDVRARSAQATLFLLLRTLQGPGE